MSKDPISFKSSNKYNSETPVAKALPSPTPLSRNRRDSGIHNSPHPTPAPNPVQGAVMVVGGEESENDPQSLHPHASPSNEPRAGYDNSNTGSRASVTTNKTESSVDQEVGELCLMYVPPEYRFKWKTGQRPTVQYKEEVKRSIKSRFKT